MEDFRLAWEGLVGNKVAGPHISLSMFYWLLALFSPPDQSSVLCLSVYWGGNGQWVSIETHPSTVSNLY